MDELIIEVLDELTTELQGDPSFDADILAIKVKGAYRDVKNARNYPIYYSQEQIDNDMQKHFQNVKDVAMFDYTHIGFEFQNSSNENDVSRSWVSKSSLLKGVIPIGRIN